MNTYPGRFVGDVGHFYLNYVPMFIKCAPNVKIPCIKRDRASVIDSHLRVAAVSKTNSFTSKRSRHWDDNKWTLATQQSLIYRPCHPKFDLPLEEAAGAYWDMYYETAQKYQAQYPDNFRIFETDSCLNTQDGQEELLSNFIGFDNPLFNVGIKTFKEAK
jgi:hypothetical protein